MKRSLLSHPSPFNANVTIFEPANSSEGTVRRSKRLKLSAGSTAQALTKPPQYSEEDEEPVPAPPKTPKKSRVMKVEVKTEVVTTSTPENSESKGPKPKRNASPRKPKPIPTALETPHPAPARWREAYDTIKRMRARIVAPVDTMGCDQAQFKETDPKVFMLLLGSPRVRMFLIHVVAAESTLFDARLAHAVFADQR